MPQVGQELAGGPWYVGDAGKGQCPLAMCYGTLDQGVRAMDNGTKQQQWTVISGHGGYHWQLRTLGIGNEQRQSAIKSLHPTHGGFHKGNRLAQVLQKGTCDLGQHCARSSLLASVGNGSRHWQSAIGRAKMMPLPRSVLGLEHFWYPSTVIRKHSKELAHCHYPCRFLSQLLEYSFY